jgi:phytoene dehydrogenase-like protein
MMNSEMENKPIVIIGGGLAGICCARELQTRGLDFVLVEASDRLGGRVRTETVDGFRLDVGFQVLLTSYPEAQRKLDFDRLQLGRFRPGAMIRFRHRFTRLADPWRQPLQAFGTLFSPVATLPDKWRLARLRARVCRGTDDEALRGAECSTIDRLQQLGFSARFISSFFQPFMGGVFLERDLRTSARKFDYLFRMFSKGDAALPAGGMARIPEQLAAGIPRERLRLNFPVQHIEHNRVFLKSGFSIEANRIVVACDPWNAAKLLNDTPPAAGNSTGVLYYSTDRSPLAMPELVLNGDGTGPINSVCVPSLVAKDYAPPGMHLISVTVMNQEAVDDETAVRMQLLDWFGTNVSRWQHLSTIKVAQALPLQLTIPDSQPQNHAVLRPDGVIQCGDYLDVASIQGAMRSGRAAAEMVLRSRI